MYLPKTKEEYNMVRKMNLDGRARKALVAAIEELTGEKAVYRRMPTCNYDIGEITVLKDGSIDFPDGSDIIVRLAEMGFAKICGDNVSSKPPAKKSKAESPRENDTGNP